MSKRLQVLLLDAEMEAIRNQAKIDNLSVGEYVRRALREADGLRPKRSPGAKLASIREGAGHSFPTADIDEMKREIERGYLS
jgi:hypothetical protein